MHATLPLLARLRFPTVTRVKLETLQVNLGYKCNQSCVHCHVNAGPKRIEMMNQETVAQVLAFAERARIQTLDLTGGAPELNPHFRFLVQGVRERGVRVIDRCNLTILDEPGQEDLAEFLAANRVEITASLPCYLEENVDAQRGKGVFQGSIKGLRKLNSLGYGDAASGLVLNLVYNPQGPVLPPPQQELETAYKKHLADSHGIVFNHLHTLANMPINRFGSALVSKGQFENYMHLLRKTHRDENLASVMCRNLVSVDWRGYVYDCDFNQMLGLPLGAGDGTPVHISRLRHDTLDGAGIAVRDHCYGCTAGQGSSCTGALTG